VSEEAAEIKPMRPWSPNMEKNTPLKCGCSIPWPVITLLGSGGKVHCDLHGWQHVTNDTVTKAKQRARKEKKQCLNPDQLAMDPPPF
jgi:hypothetical protein